MALLTEGGLVLRWIYKHGPPGGGRTIRMMIRQDITQSFRSPIARALLGRSINAAFPIEGGARWK